MVSLKYICNFLTNHAQKSFYIVKQTIEMIVWKKVKYFREICIEFKMKENKEEIGHQKPVLLYQWRIQKF